MLKEAKDFIKDAGGQEFIADMLKTLGMILGILDHEAIWNWIQRMAVELSQNRVLREHWETSKAFIRKTYRLFFISIIPRVVLWIVLIMALLSASATAGKGVGIIVFCLFASFLIGLAQVVLALRGHIVVEIALGAGGLLRRLTNGMLRVLPSPLQTQLSGNQGLVEAARGVYRIPYKVLFYEGVIDIALAVIACLTFRTFHGAILGAAVPSLLLLGLGLTIGYDLRSNMARIWSFRFVMVSMAVGLILLVFYSVVGKERIDAWSASKSVKTMKEDMVYNVRRDQLAEANALYFATKALEAKGDPKDKKQIALNYDTIRWLTRESVNKGPRPALEPDPMPTCSDSKDNNKNGVKDRDDASCYGPVIASVCVKTTVDAQKKRTQEIDPDCRNQFVGVNGGQPLMVATPDGKRVRQWYKYDSSLDEKDLPKAMATNAPPPPPRPTNGNHGRPRPLADDGEAEDAAATLRELGLTP